jgi:hypothetical protein
MFTLTTMVRVAKKFDLDPAATEAADDFVERGNQRLAQS